MLADQLEIAREIVFLLFAVLALAAGVVKPHAENIAVAGEQLLELIAEIVVVRRGAVKLRIAVPRREIKAEFDAAAPAGLGRLAHDVALKRAVFHAVLGVLARPQAEAVVVLRREHKALEPRPFDRRDPLVAVELFRVEDRLVLGALAPFAVRKRVDAEVHERIPLRLEPIELPLRGYDVCRLFYKVHLRFIFLSCRAGCMPPEFALIIAGRPEKSTPNKCAAALENTAGFC